MISERNMEIYQRRKNGEQILHLAEEFKLSRERIRQICFEVESDLKRQERGEPPRRIRKEETELFQFVMANPLRRRHTIQMRAYNCLMHEWYRQKGYKNGLPPVEFFAGMRYNDICAMQNAGPKTVEYLMELKDCLLTQNGGETGEAHEES